MLNALQQNRHNKAIFTNDIGNGCFSEAGGRRLPWFDHPERSFKSSCLTHNDFDGLSNTWRCVHIVVGLTVICV